MYKVETHHKLQFRDMQKIKTFQNFKLTQYKHTLPLNEVL